MYLWTIYPYSVGDVIAVCVCGVSPHLNKRNHDVLTWLFTGVLAVMATDSVMGSVMINGTLVEIYERPECWHRNPTKIPSYKRMFKNYTFSEIQALQREYKRDVFYLLFNPGGYLLGCGSQAARKYETLQGTFDYVRLALFENVMNDTNLFSDQSGSDRLLVTATNGNTLPAEIVFAEYLHFMKCALKPKPRDQANGILWVLPVPALWSDAAKQMMKVAAQKVGLNKGGSDFVVLSDSVVAALSALEDLYESEGEVQQCYMLINCSDDVTDISVQRFTQRSGGTILIEEIHNTRLAYGENQVYKEFEAMLQKVLQFSDDCMEEISSLKQFKQILLINMWCGMVLEYDFGLPVYTHRIELPKPIVEHAEKQNGMSIKELLSQCKEHSLELLEEPMLRLDPATRKKFYTPQYQSLGRDIEEILHHPKCRLVTHVYLSGFLSGQKAAVDIVKQMLPSWMQLKGYINILPGDDTSVTRGAYFYTVLRDRIEVHNLCKQPAQSIFSTVTPDLSYQVQELQQQVILMREDFKLLRQSCQESQQQSRLDKEKLDQQLEQVTQKLDTQPKLFKQEIDRQLDHVQQQFNVQSKQQVQEKKQLDRMGKHIEKLSQRLNQQSKQPPQTDEQSRLVDGAVVIDKIKNSECIIMCTISQCVG